MTILYSRYGTSNLKSHLSMLRENMNLQTLKHMPALQLLEKTGDKFSSSPNLLGCQKPDGDNLAWFNILFDGKLSLGNNVFVKPGWQLTTGSWPSGMRIEDLTALLPNAGMNLRVRTTGPPQCHPRLGTCYPLTLLPSWSRVASWSGFLFFFQEQH